MNSDLTSLLCRSIEVLNSVKTIEELCDFIREKWREAFEKITSEEKHLIYIRA